MLAWATPTGQPGPASVPSAGATRIQAPSARSMLANTGAGTTQAKRAVATPPAVTVTVTSLNPGAVTVPEMSPVAASIESPAGSPVAAKLAVVPVGAWAMICRLAA